MRAAFTPTQQRIMLVLEDGLVHRRDELWVCIDDELAKDNVLDVHLHLLRRKLRSRGEDIAFERVNGSGGYRHVRLVRKD